MSGKKVRLNKHVSASSGSEPLRRISNTNPAQIFSRRFPPRSRKNSRNPRMARSNNILLFIALLGFIALFDLSEKWAFQEIEKEELFSCPDFGANFKFSNEPKYSGKVLDDITVEIRYYERFWGHSGSIWSF